MWPTVRLIESLIEQLADFEQVLDEQKPRLVDGQSKVLDRLEAQLKRVKEISASGPFPANHYHTHYRYNQLRDGTFVPYKM